MYVNNMCKRMNERLKSNLDVIRIELVFRFILVEDF